ncbi:hypothetical protein NLI96_g8533 [Meripilus lineatus]|uniref:Uncharacterized protein n=1 Tax=Meripilus lineatus TaxID=2056292 RepID=A0AAD5UX71_9APHY|nr:hypothetical protein NLI96_g8533 [Physisporinus lineatus]
MQSDYSSAPMTRDDEDAGPPIPRGKAQKGQAGVKTTKNSNPDLTKSSKDQSSRDDTRGDRSGRGQNTTNTSPPRT